MTIRKTSPKQKKHRHFKRKNGPAGVRRAAARAEKFPKLECGCQKTSTMLITCAEHTQ